MADSTRGTLPDAPTERHRAPRGASRIWGLDIARFLAVIGMMATHVWNHQTNGAPTLIDQAVAGKAAALFAVLAGVGISLTTRSDLAAGRFAAARANVAGRGIALILIGLTLGLAPGPVVVILVYYGAVFLAVIPLLRCSSRMLLAIAGALALIWPVVSSFLRSFLDQPYDLGSASWLSLADPSEVARGLLLTGVYPVPTWIVYVLVGIVVGRRVMSAADGGLRRLALRLSALGASVAVVATAAGLALTGPVTTVLATRMGNSKAAETLFTRTVLGAPPAGDPLWLLSPAPHSGTLLDLAITTGTALLVLGLTLLLGAVLSDPARRLLEPVRAAGAAPLTAYTAHVVAVAIVYVFVDLTALTEVPWFLSSGALWALHIAGVLAIGAVLMLLRRRGPLETLVTHAGRLASARWRTTERSR